MDKQKVLEVFKKFSLETEGKRKDLLKYYNDKDKEKLSTISFEVKCSTRPEEEGEKDA
jgi:ribosomal protein S15P/S13E